MTRNDDRYLVIANLEDAYAVWPVAAHDLPTWRHTGYAGTLQECRDHIRSIENETRAEILRVRLEAGRVRP